MTDPIVPVKGFSHVAVRVDDVPRSADWYARVFGYDVFIDERTSETFPRTIGSIGGVALELFKSDTPKTAPRDEASPGYALVSFAVDDIDATHARLREAGVTKLDKPIEMGGMRLVFVRDPDGVLLEVIQLPRRAASLAEYGTALRERAAAPAS